MMFNPMPTKVVPDYAAVAEHVKEHGYMLLDKSVPWNALHTSMHKFGLGVRQVRDPHTNEQIGWRVAPVRKKASAE